MMGLALASVGNHEYRRRQGRVAAHARTAAAIRLDKCRRGRTSSPAPNSITSPPARSMPAPARPCSRTTKSSSPSKASRSLHRRGQYTRRADIHLAGRPAGLENLRGAANWWRTRLIPEGRRCWRRGASWCWIQEGQTPTSDLRVPGHLGLIRRHRRRNSRWRDRRRRSAAARPSQTISARSTPGYDPFRRQIRHADLPRCSEAGEEAGFAGRHPRPGRRAPSSTPRSCKGPPEPDRAAPSLRRGHQPPRQPSGRFGHRHAVTQRLQRRREARSAISLRDAQLAATNAAPSGGAVMAFTNPGSVRTGRYEEGRRRGHLRRCLRQPAVPQPAARTPDPDRKADQGHARKQQWLDPEAGADPAGLEGVCPMLGRLPGRMASRVLADRLRR